MNFKELINVALKNSSNRFLNRYKAILDDGEKIYVIGKNEQSSEEPLAKLDE